MEKTTVLEEQIQSAKKSWLILYPVDVAVTAYFAFIIFGVVAAYTAGKNLLDAGDISSAFGNFSLAAIFIIIAILFGWGTTHTEKTLHMDEKKGNDYVVIILIVLTGIIASGARYLDTQKTLYTNTEEYLSKHNAEYQGYMKMLHNNYGGDDDKAIAAMDKMKKEYIESQTSAGDKYRMFYEIPFAMILAVLINFCFGIMVSKYYKLRKQQECGGSAKKSIAENSSNNGTYRETSSPTPETASINGSYSRSNSRSTSASTGKAQRKKMLKSYLASNPNATLSEMASAIGVSSGGTVRKYLEEMGYNPQHAQNGAKFSTNSIDDESTEKQNETRSIGFQSDMTPKPKSEVQIVEVNGNRPDMKTLNQFNTAAQQERYNTVKMILEQRPELTQAEQIELSGMSKNTFKSYKKMIQSQ